MTHFALVCPPLSGHLNPMLDLGRELVRRGHRVTVFGHVDLAPRFVDGVIGFRAVGQGSHPPGSLVGAVGRVTAATGVWGIGAVITDMASMTDMLATELPSAFAAAGIDAVVTDQLEAAGGLVARHMGLPYASVANALPINRDPAVPPFFSHWLADGSAWAIRRNKGAEDVSDWMMHRHAAVIAKHAGAWNLGPLTTCADCLSPTADIAQIVPAFDFPRSSPPAAFHYTGPIRAPLTGDGLAFPFATDAGDTRPIVFASLGTLFGGRCDIFAAIARACVDLDARLIVAHGGRLTPAQCQRLAGSPAVFDFVPQRAWLPRVAACVTHAGMNTVMDAMAAGVPTLALPLAYDQPGIAARLSASGAGLRLTPWRLSSGLVRRSLMRLLREPAFGAAARKLRTDIADAGGLAAAAALVEHAAQAPVAQRPAHAT